MANRVITYFEGDPSHLFRTADEVEARVRRVNQASPAAQGPSPVIAQEQAITAAVEKTQATVRSGFSVYDERARKAEQAARTEISFEEARARIVQRAAQAAIDADNRVAEARRKRGDVTTAPVAAAAAQSAGRDLIIARARLNTELAALEEASSRFDIREIAKRSIAAREANAAVLAARERLLLETGAIEKAETAVVVEQTARRAASRRGELSASSPLGGFLRGAGAGAGGLGRAAGLFSGGNLAGAAGFAIAGTAVLSVKEYAQNLAETEQRERRLAVASRELGISQDDLSKAIKETSTGLRQTKEEAEQVVRPIGELASQSQKPLGDLKNAVLDIASARGINKDELPNILKNVAEGTADTALFGKNAAVIFDEYATKLGTTAERLSTFEKQQALVNELLEQGARHAGEAANAAEKQSSGFEALETRGKSLLQTLGAVINLPVKAFFEDLTTRLGGQPDYARFDASRLVQSPLSLSPLGAVPNLDTLRRPNPLKAFADDFEKEAAETKVRMEKYKQDFQNAQKEVADAIANPNKNIVNRSIANLDVQKLFASGGHDNYEAVKRQAIADAKELQEARVRGFEDGIRSSTGDLSRLKQISRNLDVEQNLIDPDAFRRLSDQASKAISDGYRHIIDTAQENLPALKQIYREILGTAELNAADKNALLEATAHQLSAGLRDMIADARTNVPKLREIFSQVLKTPLTPNDRTDLIHSINEAITESVKQGKAKVLELKNAFQSVFDSINGRVAQGNPFLQFLNESAERMRKLQEATKGFSAELRKALEQRQQIADQKELSNLQADAKLEALDLKTRAQEFRQGKRFDPNDAEQIQKNVDQQFIALGIRGAGLGNQQGPPTLLNTNPVTRTTGQVSVPANLQRVYDLNGNPQSGMFNVEKTDTGFIYHRPGDGGGPYTTQQREILAQKPLTDADYEAAYKRQGLTAQGPGPVDASKLSAAQLKDAFAQNEKNFAEVRAKEEAKRPKIDQETQDRKLEAMSRTLDPSKLREDQRQTIAEALERQADRREKQGQEAEKQFAEQTKIQQQLLKELQQLNQLAAHGGLDAIVKVVNESDRANVTTRPRQAAVKSKYPAR